MTESSKNKQIKKLKLNMILGFTGMIVVLITLVVTVFSVRMSSAMKKQTADMLMHLNGQLGATVSGYMTNVEGAVDSICADTLISAYPEDVHYNSAIEIDILNKLSLYATMPNYTDLGIVYDDCHTVGKFSELFIEAAGNNIFAYVRNNIKKNEGIWTTTIIPGHSRLVYIAPINANAVAVAAIDTDDIVSNFSESKYISGMNSYLVDNSLVIQATNDSMISAGSYLKTNIYRLVNRNGETTIGANDVVATSSVGNGWFVITAVPCGNILGVLNATVAYVIIISSIILVFGIVFIVFMSARITNAMSKTVDQLDVKSQTDLLTGLLNKRSFEEIVDITLNNPEPGKTYALVFMDVDNFKGVNDRCGHDVGDAVLRSFSHSIGTAFREGDIKGRLGGDEFCVLMKLPQGDVDSVVATVNEACSRFKDALYRKATSARQSLPAVTSSMGAAIWSGAPEGFEGLYRKADTAVYASKKRGKNTWSIYGQDNVDDSIRED